MKSDNQIQFDFERSQKLGEIGLYVAVNNAGPDWSERCWELFKRWISKKPVGFEFQVERFRADLYKFNMIEKPPSERAFGFISKRAVKEGLIECAGTGKCANVKAHSTPVNKWRKI
jgi:hypothetical protein